MTRAAWVLMIGGVFLPLTVLPFVMRSLSQAPEPQETSIPAPDTAGQSGSDEAGAMPEGARGCIACDTLDALTERFAEGRMRAARRAEALAEALKAPAPLGGRAEAGLLSERRRRFGEYHFRTREAASGLQSIVQVLEATAAACKERDSCGIDPLLRRDSDGCSTVFPSLNEAFGQIATIGHSIAMAGARCSAASCPTLDCTARAKAAIMAQNARRTLTALKRLPPQAVRFHRQTWARFDRRARTLARETLAAVQAVPAVFEMPDRFGAEANWRGRVRAAQILAGRYARLARDARRLYDDPALQSAKPAPPGGPGVPPLWRLRLLSLRLDYAGERLLILADALSLSRPRRGQWIEPVSRELATALAAVVIEAERLKAVLALEARPQDDPVARHRCHTRRAQKIARGQAQLEAVTEALDRCGVRAACPATDRLPGGDGAAAGVPGWRQSGLDWVSAHEARLDTALGELSEAVAALSVGFEKPAVLEADLNRYEAGEAISLRVDMRGTACMAEEGAFVALARARSPRVSSGEASVLERLYLRGGRPWEELLFEAPREPGSYEFRAYTPAARGGGITGVFRIQVAARSAGCKGFDGRWDTNFGILNITVRDGEARGSYKRRAEMRSGFLSGTVSGRTLRGEWRSDLGGGGTRLRLSEDGTRFEGTWSHFRDEVAGTGEWNGTCIAASPGGDVSTE